MVGKPVVRGTRVPVSLILNLIAHGYTFERVVEEYPVLSEADVRAAILSGVLLLTAVALVRSILLFKP